VGVVLLFAAGAYMSQKIKNAAQAAPVPASAMAPLGIAAACRSPGFKLKPVQDSPPGFVLWFAQPTSGAAGQMAASEVISRSVSLCRASLGGQPVLVPACARLYRRQISAAKAAGFGLGKESFT